MTEELLKRNKAWAGSRLSEDPEYFRRLSALQAPDYLWIGCSDSRVPANAITGLDPGEIFVHRNVANQVNTLDLNCMSVVQFAVEELKVKHIIICGHHGCSGVRAAIDGQRHGLIDHWVRPIRELSEHHAHELADMEAGARADRLCELNVRAQVENLVKSPFIEDAWSRGQPLAVHGWLYGLHNGLLSDLHVTRSG